MELLFIDRLSFSNALPGAAGPLRVGYAAALPWYCHTFRMTTLHCTQYGPTGDRSQPKFMPQNSECITSFGIGYAVTTVCDLVSPKYSTATLVCNWLKNQDMSTYPSINMNAIRPLRPLRLRRKSGRQLPRYLSHVRPSIPISSQSSKHVHSFKQCKIHVHKATFFAALGCIGQLNLRILSVFRRCICLEVQGSPQSPGRCNCPPDLVLLSSVRQWVESWSGTPSKTVVRHLQHLRICPIIRSWLIRSDLRLNPFFARHSTTGHG